MKYIHLLSLFTAFVGCAAEPGYMREHDAWWAYNAGYTDFPLGKDKYRVSYTGALGNSPSTVMKYTYQRAKEICSEQGFNDFISSNATSSALVSGGGSINRSVSTQTVYSLDVECRNH